MTTPAAGTATMTAGLGALRARLASSADGIVESLAREFNVSPLTVLTEMPPECRSLIDGSRFADVMHDVESWGDVLLIVHTADVVLECAGPIPPGSFGRGYYNMHGDSPISGHIKAENCQTIAFVSRPFMGRESRSIQFFNAAGEAMFKIFVRRDESKALKPEQVARFDSLRKRMASENNARGA